MALTPQFGTIVPSQVQEILNSNYLQWTDPGTPATFADFAQHTHQKLHKKKGGGSSRASGFRHWRESNIYRSSLAKYEACSEFHRLHSARS